MHWRHVAYLYLIYVAFRVGVHLSPVGGSSQTSYLRDADLVQQSLARFRQMGLGSKAAVVLVGVPLYLYGELVPHEAGILVDAVGHAAWHYAVQPCLDMAVRSLQWAIRSVVVPLLDALTRCVQWLWAAVFQPILHFLHNTMISVARSVLDAVEYVLRIVADYAVVPLYRAVRAVWHAVQNYVVAPIVNAAHRLCSAVWRRVVLPLVIGFRSAMHWFCTTLWDWLMVPIWRSAQWIVRQCDALLAILRDVVVRLWLLLWDVALQPLLDLVAMARDLVLAVWLPVRNWLVDKFYRLCSFVYTIWCAIYNAVVSAILTPVAAVIYEVFAAVYGAVHAAATATYDTVEVGRDFVASLFTRGSKPPQ